MQNKGLFRFLAIVLAIACAYQLSFTLVSKSVEKKAARYAEQFPAELRDAKEQAYLDSIKSKDVYNLWVKKYTYKEVKEHELNLGLDLKGGMNVMLEISVEDVVRALSNDNADPVFNQAMANAAAQTKTSGGNFITVFAKEYATLSNNAPLAFIFNQSMKEKVSPTSSNDEVVKALNEEAESAIANSYNVLRSRIDRFGVTQPNIQRLEGGGRILVELPGVKEPERVRKLLQGTASLEFWSTYSNTELFGALTEANAIIRDLEATGQIADSTAVETEQAIDAAATEAAETVPMTELTDTATANAEANAEGDTAVVESKTDEDLVSQIAAGSDSTKVDNFDTEAYAKQFPLFSKLQPVMYQNGQPAPGPVVGHAFSYDTAAVNAYLAIPQVRATLPRDLKLMWGVKAVDDGESLYELYAIKANTRDGKAPLDGGVVTDANQSYGEQGSNAEVSMSMNGTGARAWARLTADNIDRWIAIVLDGYVYSAPMVHSEITGGRSQITGNFTIQEATDLANVLKSGKLPAPARIIQDTVVGPSLGQESIDASVISFILAFVLVLLYMFFFYNTAGMTANIALIANVFFLFGVLASFGAVLTLPGIAGIVLTMGMAVDANVIIYERIKEELRAGKGLSLAINEGYKNAMSAIIDSNITTIITGVVLFIFGTGPVQGFATTLIVGILTSLFCSLFITRLIFASMLKRGRNIRFSNKWTENFLSNTKVDFIGIRKISYIVSCVLILIGIGTLCFKGLNLGVEFSGGRTFVVRFDQPVTADAVREAVNTTFASAEGDEAYKSSTVMQFGDETQMRIVTQYKYDDQSDDATAAVENLLYTALSPLYANNLSIDEFTSTSTNPNGIISADMVGPSVARDVVRKAFIAVFFSLIAIGLYIFLRFKRWQWGVGSTAALAHDSFLTIGLFSLMSGWLPFTLEIDQSFIAAILTIIGYSINDKVVIFDRIREYTTLYPKRNMRETINAAVNTTLARTVNTSGTTFVTLLAIFLFGGASIRGFIFALMFGVIIGTLSSIFTATPIAYDLMNKKTRKEEDKK